MFTAVVRLLSDADDAQTTINSILANSEDIRQVIVHRPGWDEVEDDGGRREMYPGWGGQRAKLRAAGIDVEVVSYLSEEILGAMISRTSAWVVEMPLYCHMTREGFKVLGRRVKSETRTHVDHYALQSHIQLCGHRSQMRECILYGFLLMAFAMEWVMGWFTRRHYYSHTDVRVRSVRGSGDIRYVAPSHILLPYLLNGQVARPCHVHIRDCAIRVPDHRRGWALVMSYLSQSSILGIGLWWAAWALIYTFFAVPWWQLISVLASRVDMAKGATAVVGVFMMGQSVTLELFVLLFGRGRMRYPARWFTILLAPLYFAAMPTVLLYAKLVGA